MTPSDITAYVSLKNMNCLYLFLIHLPLWYTQPHNWPWVHSLYSVLIYPRNHLLWVFILLLYNIPRCPCTSIPGPNLHLTYIVFLGDAFWKPVISIHMHVDAIHLYLASTLLGIVTIFTLSSFQYTMSRNLLQYSESSCLLLISHSFAIGKISTHWQLCKDEPNCV